jgi:hypothetical protein
MLKINSPEYALVAGYLSKKAEERSKHNVMADVLAGGTAGVAGSVLPLLVSLAMRKPGEIQAGDAAAIAGIGSGLAGMAAPGAILGGIRGSEKGESMSGALKGAAGTTLGSIGGGAVGGSAGMLLGFALLKALQAARRGRIDGTGMLPAAALFGPTLGGGFLGSALGGAIGSRFTTTN